MRLFAAIISHAFTAALLLLALTTTNVLAAGGCFESGGQFNLGAWRGVDPSASATGVRGNMDHYARNPAANNGIAHPVQISPPYYSDNFVGLGTYKNHNTNFGCVAHTGTTWKIYYDGIDPVGYFCHAAYGTVADGAQDQTARITWGECPFYPYDSQWVAFWNGVVKTCRALDIASAEAVAAGGESVGPSGSEEIDVHYDSMVWRQGASTWNAWNPNIFCENRPPFLIVVDSNQAFSANKI